jgi:hypothetical protein
VCKSENIIFTFFLLYYFLFTQYLYTNQTRRHVSMVVRQRHDQRHLKNAIAHMTQQRYRATANVASAMSWLAWLGSGIVPWPTSPWRHHRQRQHAMVNVTSAALSPARLDSAIASMIRQRHRTMANVTSATPSPTWLSSNITPQPTSPR